MNAPEAARDPWRSRIVGEADVAPDQLLANPQNFRVHPKAQQEAMRGTLDRLGFVQRVVVNRTTGHVVDGHLRVELALRHGQASVPVVYVELSEDEERLALATLDPIGAMAVTDDKVLEGLLGDLRAKDDSLAELLEGVHGPIETESAPELDEVPPEQKAAVTRVGDLWELGRHRLLCGDSFDTKDRARLLDSCLMDCVLTDPPFAIYGSASGISASVADDKMVRPFFEQLGRALADSLKFFGHAYVCCDWRSYATMWDGFKRAELTPKNCLVWDKGGAGLGNNWSNAHEFVAYFAKLHAQQTMTSGARAGQRSVLKSNILRFNRVSGEEREHNAAKPIEMLREILEAATDRDGLVLDLFGGSGSTLIAAEASGRSCRMMELEPKWVDVIVRRWQRVTKAVATLAGDGSTFDEVRAQRLG